MASKYRRCPNCTSERNGNSVKRCRDCGKNFCTSCEMDSHMYTCPNCKSNNCETIGYIDPNA